MVHRKHHLAEHGNTFRVSKHSTMDDGNVLATSRRSYESGSLDESRVAPDPIVQLRIWLDEAFAAKAAEPNAMTLATVGSDGHPSARVVLLRGLDERGLVFYTNFKSRKGHELDAVPFASLVFYWPLVERQVRVEGSVERVSDAESDAYFATRPRGHRIGAWASPQSEAVPDRAFLEHEVARVEETFKDRDVTRPPFWGGYRVRPTRVEFWQGRRDRVHDRVAYERRGDDWAVQRLGP